MRFADILTTSSAVANYLGAMDVSAAHMLDAIEILAERKTLDDLGRPVSPLVPRPRNVQPGADPGVRAIAQRWFAEQGNDVNAELDDGDVGRLQEELRALL